MSVCDCAGYDAMAPACSPSAAARLAISDVAGHLTYFSNRHVIALDGLANSSAYVVTVLRPGRVDVHVHQKAGFLVLIIDGEHALQRTESSGNGAEYVASIGFLLSRQGQATPYRSHLEQVVARIPAEDQRRHREVWLIRVDRTAGDAGATAPAPRRARAYPTPS